MSKQRKQYTEEFKATVALEAVKGEKSLQELAAQYGVAAGQISEWKQQLQQGAAQLFVRKNKADKNVRKLEKKVNDLEQLVGQREYELAWLKKGNECIGVEGRYQMIDETEPRISVRRQCQLLDLSKSRYYYTEKRSEIAKARDKQAKQIILAWLLKDPCLVYRRLATHVSNALQYQVNRKYVRRLMKELGLKAIYCKRNTSKPHPQHEKVPYLLKGMQIDKPDMVWATDITYLKVEGRTYYLCAVIDWASREALGYSVGRNMTVELCHEALTMALARGRKPQILNTDQGSQFTSESWLSRVRQLGIKPSMDGKGSWRDNVRMERFWRTYKYELFNLYDDVPQKAIEQRLKTWIRYYNSERLHSSLGNKTPEEWREEHQSAA